MPLPACPVILGGMSQERDDYRDLDRPPSGNGGTELVITLIVAAVVLVVVAVLFVQSLPVNS